VVPFFVSKEELNDISMFVSFLFAFFLHSIFSGIYYIWLMDSESMLNKLQPEVD
jgi:hypothetical protein